MPKGYGRQRKGQKMLAIVETGGKQYQLQEGKYVDMELLGKEADAKVEFDKIVMIVAGEESKIGQPYVEDAVAKGTILLNGKSKKILVYKQRCKKGYRKKQGHRQQFSRVMIDSINFPGRENMKIEVEAPAEKPKKAAKAKTVTVEAEKETKTAKKPAAKKTEDKPAAKKTAAKKTAAKKETTEE